MYTSEIKELGKTVFPEFTGERIYMRKFTKEKGLPNDISRWQETVDGMLQEVETDQPIFIMVDQSYVEPGISHRRKGVHIDGYWVEELQAHGGGGGGHSVNGYRFEEKEGLILASDVKASRAFTGEWDGAIEEGGDCSGIDTSKLESLELEANTVYSGNVTMLHESLPINEGGFRTLVRLNTKGWDLNS